MQNKKPLHKRKEFRFLLSFTFFLFSLFFLTTIDSAGEITTITGCTDVADCCSGWTDDTITPGTTIIKTIHFEEMLDCINYKRHTFDNTVGIWAGSSTLGKIKEYEEIDYETTPIHQSRDELDFNLAAGATSAATTTLEINSLRQGLEEIYLNNVNAIAGSNCDEPHPSIGGLRHGETECDNKNIYPIDKFSWSSKASDPHPVTSEIPIRGSHITSLRLAAANVTWCGDGNCDPEETSLNCPMWQETDEEKKVGYNYPDFSTEYGSTEEERDTSERTVRLNGDCAWYCDWEPAPENIETEIGDTPKESPWDPYPESCGTSDENKVCSFQDDMLDLTSWDNSLECNDQEACYIYVCRYIGEDDETVITWVKQSSCFGHHYCSCERDEEYRNERCDYENQTDEAGINYGVDFERSMPGEGSTTEYFREDYLSCKAECHCSQQGKTPEEGSYINGPIPFLQSSADINNTNLPAPKDDKDDDEEQRYACEYDIYDATEAEAAANKTYTNDENYDTCWSDCCEPNGAGAWPSSGGDSEAATNFTRALLSGHTEAANAKDACCSKIYFYNSDGASLAYKEERLCCNDACVEMCKRCDGKYADGDAGTCSFVNAQRDPDNDCDDDNFGNREGSMEKDGISYEGSTCENYIFGWAGLECVKYNADSSNMGKCAGGVSECLMPPGVSLSNYVRAGIIDGETSYNPCEGDGDISGAAKCIDTACKDPDTCKPGAYETEYNTIDEVCFTNESSTIHAGHCPANYGCDEDGECQKMNGQGCTDVTPPIDECLSALCVDLTCCENDCTALCKRCDGTDTSGASGTCSVVDLNKDPDGDCDNDNFGNRNGTMGAYEGTTCANYINGWGGDANEHICMRYTATTDFMGKCNGSGSATITCIKPGDDNDPCQGEAEVARCYQKECNKACPNAGLVTTYDEASELSNLCYTNESPTVYAGHCPANQGCDEEGRCRLMNGQQCSGDNSECLSNKCINGYCCNSTCVGECNRCNVAGSLGTCVDVNSDCDAEGDDVNDCFCSSGTCQPCSYGGDAGCGEAKCTNYSCGNTHYANTTDCGLCKRCDGSGSCDNITSGDDPDNDCNNGVCDACNGSGACTDFNNKCPACQVCSGGNCSNAAAETDVKNDCNQGGCDLCNGSGGCQDYDSECGTCEECDNGECEDASEGSDPGDKCSATFCSTGVCDDSGKCAVFSDGGKHGCTDCMYCPNGWTYSHCADVPDNQDPSEDCTGDNASCTCDGSGACRGCTNPLTCSSHQCQT